MVSLSNGLQYIGEVLRASMPEGIEGGCKDIIINVSVMQGFGSPRLEILSVGVGVVDSD